MVTVTGSPLTITGSALQGAITFSLGTAATGVTFGTGPLGGLLLNFGNAQPLNTTVSATLILTNSGTAPINFTTPAGGDTVANILGTRFSKGADTCQGQTALAVGSTCSITINYNSNSHLILLTRLGTLTVRDNAAGANQTVALTGD